MKKLTIIFASLAIFAGSSAFANNGDGKSSTKISKTVQAAFLENFSKAENVSWQITEDFYFASFDLDGKTVEAAYNEKGELLGTAKHLKLSELPTLVSQTLKADYANFEIANAVTEISFEGSTFYYVKAKGAGKVFKLKCVPDGQVYVENKIKA